MNTQVDVFMNTCVYDYMYAGMHMISHVYVCTCTYCTCTYECMQGHVFIYQVVLLAYKCMHV